MNLSTSVQITLSTSVDSPAPAKEYFSPEIQLVDKSSDGKIVSTPPLYLPKFPDVQSDDYEAGKTYRLERCELVRPGLQVVRIYGSGDFTLQSLQRGNADALEPNELSEAKMETIEITAKIFDKEFKKKFTYPENNNVYSGNKIQYQGKRVALVTELLQFDGVDSRQVRYWYDKPMVKVNYASSFINENGKEISAPVNRSDKTTESDNNEVACPFLYGSVTSSTIGFNGEGSTFYAKEKCWGTLEVTYKVNFHEYYVLYDYGNIDFKFKVTKPQLERWGKTVKEIPDSGSSSEEDTYKPGHLQWQEVDQRLGTELTTEPISYLYLVKAIEIEQPETRPITLFAKNKKRQAVAQISTSAQYADIPKRSLPSLVIYQEREKYRIYPDGAATGGNFVEGEGITRIHYVTAFGEVVEQEFGAMDTENLNSETTP